MRFLHICLDALMRAVSTFLPPLAAPGSSNSVKKRFPSRAQRHKTLLTAPTVPHERGWTSPPRGLCTVTEPDSPNQHQNTQKLLFPTARGAQKMRKEVVSASHVGSAPSSCTAQAEVWGMEMSEQAGRRKMPLLVLLEKVSFKKNGC